MYVYVAIHNATKIYVCYTNLMRTAPHRPTWVGMRLFLRASILVVMLGNTKFDIQPALRALRNTSLHLTRLKLLLCEVKTV